ncbi:hypothetical protein FLONG3_5293 [Fusarium longipes]|uniref:Uncharacterized protein n=1 Tax=Fusarium longipes TaxID=694270 RepID=A0A395SWD3_9HYPO|nr:hypothetical protein FLONG3_5293 [Fusarium longipes]
MSGKRPRVENEGGDTSHETGESDTALTLASFLRHQRQQALDTLTRNDSQQQKLELTLEKKLKESQLEVQRLRSENDCLRAENAKAVAEKAPPTGTVAAASQTSASSLFVPVHVPASNKFE